MTNDSPFTDYLKGNVILDMRVTKMDNGRYKASSMGLESNHLDQAQAVRDLQDKLQDALTKGEIRLGM